MSNRTIDLLTVSTPNPNWNCLDCQVNRELDRHGRCSVCQSESVIDLTLSAFNPNNSTPEDTEDQLVQADIAEVVRLLDELEAMTILHNAGLPLKFARKGARL